MPMRLQHQLEINLNYEQWKHYFKIQIVLLIQNLMVSLSNIKVFKEEKLRQNMKKTKIVSNKGNIGHTLSGSGAIESIFAILSIVNVISRFLYIFKGLAPRNLNLENSLNSDFTLLKSNEETNIKVCLKNSYAFGGLNTSLIYNKISS
jgi:3-oxoacyl-(acyl-carrier-protein) synthase